MEITGTITKIYADKGNWASIVIKDDAGKTYRAAGRILNPVVGLKIQAKGEMEENNYGIQLKVSDAKIVVDKTSQGMIAYLSSGFIKGVGPKRAKAIIEKFGNNAGHVIEAEPEKLAEISGITPKKAMEISNAYKESIEYLKIIDLLGGDATMYQVRSIYEKYKGNSVTKLKENPYTVIYDLDGFGFKKADLIAAAMGISGDDPRRLGAAVVYVLKTLRSEGHCFCRLDALEGLMQNLIKGVHMDKLADVISREIKDEHLVLDGDKLYTKDVWVDENETARLIGKLVKSTPVKEIPDIRIKSAVQSLEKKVGYTFEGKQREAITFVPQNRLCVITGGPGTGKTTIIQGIISVWNDMDRLFLIAPTGRAAKRMAEVTNLPAQTIHKLLIDYRCKPSQYKDCKALVIADEASMLDIELAHRILRFVDETQSALVLIGDVDQLPPIGPGNFFKDVVQSPCVPTVMLELSFRQSGKIATNAKKINAGSGTNAYAMDESFQFISAKKDNVQETVVKEYKKLLMQYPPEEICCITPIRKGMTKRTSADALNAVLRNIANPEKPGEKQLKNCPYRIGDRVMQIVNDAKRWVMNGDCGTVRSVNEDDNLLIVRMDDGRNIEYMPNEISQLTLAYATTVHKSQGSEYKAVIVLQCWEHYILLQRALLYTGVTRAKEKVILIGEKAAVNYAVKTVPNTVRNTQLRIKIGKEVS